MTILLICPDVVRQASRKAALQAAGFRTVLAGDVDQGLRMLDGFDIAAVVVDHEFKDDPAAKQFGERYITLRLEEYISVEETVMELAQLFKKGSQSLQ